VCVVGARSRLPALCTTVFVAIQPSSLPAPSAFPTPPLTTVVPISCLPAAAERGGGWKQAAEAAAFPSIHPRGIEGLTFTAQEVDAHAAEQRAAGAAGVCSGDGLLVGEALVTRSAPSTSSHKVGERGGYGASRSGACAASA
jgi:hypothetical protein